jgi:hypothetical protein
LLKEHSNNQPHWINTEGTTTPPLAQKAKGNNNKTTSPSRNRISYRQHPKREGDLFINKNYHNLREEGSRIITLKKDLCSQKKNRRRKNESSTS